MYGENYMLVDKSQLVFDKDQLTYKCTHMFINMLKQNSFQL